MKTVSRRNLLRTGAMAAAAMSLGTRRTEAEPVRAVTPIRLGLASYTFRQFTRSQVIGFMQQLQIDGINCKDVKDHLPMQPELEQAAVADYAAHQITTHAVGAVYFTKDDDADIRSKFEYAKRAGVKVIVAGDPSPASLPRVERFVREYDMRVAIHNHGPEDKLWQSPLDILRLVRTMDPRIGCCIDVGHTARAGTDVIEAIHTVGPRLFNVHMKDLADMRVKESQVAVGRGRMPVRGIFQALRAIRYEGFVDLEYEIHADDPMPGVIESFAYMRGVLAGMDDVA